MTTLEQKAPVPVVVIGLEPGEMLLESIREAIEKHGVRDGVVVSGVGTLKVCRMHFIEHTDFPPTDGFFTLEKPLEVASLAGVIADGQPHLHMVVSCKDQEVYAGHLEDGCEVAYLAEIAILRLDGLVMTRRPDEARRIRLLGAK